MILASTCNYKHGLSLFSTPLPAQEEAVPSLALSQVVISNVFEHFNSIIGFESSSPPDLLVTQSEFKGISICGAIISPTHSPPFEPTDELAVSFNSASPLEKKIIHST